MTRQQRRLIRQSYEAVSTETQALGLLFYGRLFELDPSLRPMFRGDLRMQSQKLMDTLGSLMSVLDDLSTAEETLQALGQRHAGYGVKPQHYQTVCEAMEWALAQVLEVNLEAEAILAWRELLQTVSAVMLSGTVVPVP